MIGASLRLPSTFRLPNMVPQVNMRVQKFGFDAGRVRRAVNNARNPVLARQGAYTRGAARRLIRRRKNPATSSPAGTPPFTHTGALKRSILFSVGESSVVIGPTYSGIGRIGATHEWGGTESTRKGLRRRSEWNIHLGGFGPFTVRSGRTILIRLKTSRMVRKSRDDAARLAANASKTRKYPARPFMAPALEQVRPKLAEFWRGAVTRTA